MNRGEHSLRVCGGTTLRAGPVILALGPRDRNLLRMKGLPLNIEPIARTEQSGLGQATKRER